MNPWWVPSTLIALGIPAVFLLAIYALDLYASRSFQLVLSCALWGAIGAAVLGALVNGVTAGWVAGLPLPDPTWLQIVVIAPLVEEVLKSLCFFYVSRRPQFTYFVDGAIYGFAAGIGFSVRENLVNLQAVGPAEGIALLLIRAFSTCLMHGTASGLIGVAAGWSRLNRRPARTLAVVAGGAAAILLHAAFNGVAHHVTAGAMTTAVLVPIGLAGVGLIALFVLLGLRQERQWIAQTLSADVGLTDAEGKLAQSYGQLATSTILREFARRFPRQAEQAKELLRFQAHLGIQLKVQQQVGDPRLRRQLGQEIVDKQREARRLRRKLGVYAMVYLRAVSPSSTDVWKRLEEVAATRWPGQSGAPSYPTASSVFERLAGKRPQRPPSGDEEQPADPVAR